ncbi:unnamed protein product [Trifolium pratense]|uniref:Uncharacterized protein n=1 Tax=Trifolium pratense TaxID=57577 RepID=A0ACB0KW39_TRIPR|nr:unnamed protein product [Trifolium pratense]
MPTNHRHNELQPYNIIPLNNDLNSDHPSLRFPEVRAAISAIRTVGDLRRPPRWQPHMDLLDWLALFFGFQNDNVRNQREHLLLHLANSQMRLNPLPDNIDSLDSTVLRSFRKNLLKNYTKWCSYLAVKPSVWLSGRHSSKPDHRRELLYVALYLLIWGESANLRFVPECICYIFHHMAIDLNKLLQNQPYGYDDELPFCLEKGFLDSFLRCKPRWENRLFEQRSFWNLFRSFDRLWVMLILFLQAAVIVGWKDRNYPWHVVMKDRDVQVRLLTLFFTWSGLRFFQSVLDIVMQWRLVSRETKMLGFRMVLKTIVAAAWIVVFSYFYAKTLSRRNRDHEWSVEANKRLMLFLAICFAFVIPELLALALFILPWVRNFMENRNWMLFYMLSWWFQGSIYVGRGLSQGLVDNVKYTLFWAVVLASKFSFSYFLQILPMMAPSRAVLDLKDVDYHWHEFFKNGNVFALGILWIPVVLIYLMDIQIWYSIYSSLVGATVGLFAHLGEIRSMQQLKLRFQFFATAVLFNLMPEEQLLNARGTLGSKLRDAVRRFKLRYGLGKPFKKLESNLVEAKKFAMLWNEIILSFREEDIISDKEVELLELPNNAWNVRVIRWPCFLLCNELLLALSQAKELADSPDRRIWRKICKYEFRRCAVVEAYDCIRYLLREIIKPDSEEHSIVTALFQEIDHSLEIGKFTKVFKTTALPQIHSKLINLIELLNKGKQDTIQLVNALQALYEISIRDFFKEKRNNEQLKEDGLAPQNPSSGVLIFENAI